MHVLFLLEWIRFPVFLWNQFVKKHVRTVMDLRNSSWGECQKTVINVNEYRVLFGRNELGETNPLPIGVHRKAIHT